jgi:hypothetical protein
MSAEIGWVGGWWMACDCIPSACDDGRRAESATGGQLDPQQRATKGGRQL